MANNSPTSPDNNKNNASSSGTTRSTSSPSMVSPVGNAGDYCMMNDDDENDFQSAAALISPILPSSENGNSQQRERRTPYTIRNSNEHGHETTWHYYDDDDDEYHRGNTNTGNGDDDDDRADPPRLRLDSDMQTALLSHRNNEPAKLNGLNYLNVVTYLLNVFVSYGIGVWGLGGLVPTRWQVSKQFSTLVTPAEWAYVLWAPILLFEAIFAVAQLFPHYRARPIIQQGTGFFFFYTCLIQTAWTLFFALEIFVASFVAVVLALLSLASLLASQQASRVRGRKSLVEYWLFKFPFYLHCGWLILCSVVQFAMIFRHFTSNVGVQLAADVVALGVMLPAATFFLTGQPSGPDFVIPLVIIWSYIAIAEPLHHPSPELMEIYDHSAIVAVRDSAYFFAAVVGIMFIPRFVVWVAREFCTINVVELDGLATTDRPSLPGDDFFHNTL